ncbi:MAG TPA: DUF3455 domain-containing protein [Polyangia bacterium]|nr:DUF3455 domain-containing protein [Polyangia bacterium]
MRTTIGRHFVVGMLLAAGCSSSGGSPGAGGSGGSAPVGSGGATGMAGAPATGGTMGMAGSPAGGSSGGGTSGAGGAGGAAPWLASPAGLPPTLAVPLGATLKLHDRGVGAQVYTCTASTPGAGGAGGTAGPTYSWVLKAPDAMLLDEAGVQVGTHGAGPEWTSTDGSVVNGVKVVQENSPLSDAIPWLLLRAISTTGTGVFSDVTYVQRVNTMGGKAPATGCDATTAGTDTRVSYTADYYFYTGGGLADWANPPANLPAAIAVPAGQVLALHDHAIGAQVYTCTGSGGADAGPDGGAVTYAWVLKAPDAVLYDAAFTQVGTHGAGPNWTSTVDGSVVNGMKVTQADAPMAGAIPWLLLQATSTSGAGVFTNVTYVQRLNTNGGKAPASGCDATTAGTETRVTYSADYDFYRAAAGDAGT